MNRKQTDRGRRAFLRNAVTTGIAASAAAASVDAVAGLAPEGGNEAEKASGYRLTDHVKAYYQSFTR